MSLMQVRNWRRTYRRQRAHRRALNNLLWTSCRLMAISLVGVAFLFYRLDMPGTSGIFTDTAWTNAVTFQAGWGADLVEVQYSRNDNYFHTRATNKVTFIIRVANVNPDSVYLTYKGVGLDPNTCIYVEDEKAVYATYENKGNNKYFGDFLNNLLDKVEFSEAQEIVVTLHWKLMGEDSERSYECKLRVFAPDGHVNVEFKVISTSGKTLFARDKAANINASGEEWLVANIQLMDGGSADAIDTSSLRLVYGESYLEHDWCELVEDTLRVYFNRAVVDAWLQGLGVQGEEVLLTITGEMNTEEGTIPFAASNYYQPAIRGEGKVNLSLRIKGPVTITIPVEGEVTETYTAVVLDGAGEEVTGQEIVWSLADEIAGVTVADGMVTVTSEAVEGSFTLTAALVGWEEINDTIAVQLLADAGGGAAGPPAGEVPPGEGELPPEGGEEPLPEGEEPPVDEEDPPSEGEEPRAEDDTESEEEPGEKPPEEGGEPEDDGEVPPEEEAIREDDEDGGGNTGDQDGGDDDHRGLGGGGEEALPREDDEDGGGAYEGEDGSDDEPNPEENGSPAETGSQGEAGNSSDHYEKGREADVAGSEGVPETGNDGDKDEPSGESEPADAVGDTGSQGQEAPAGE